MSWCAPVRSPRPKARTESACHPERSEERAPAPDGFFAALGMTPRDRVHLIELPLGPRRTVNAVLVEGDPLTLVDTGVNSPESLAALESALAARGRRIADLEQIVVTHAHPDHFGAAAELVRRSGARVLADNAETLAAYPGSFEAR